MVIPLSHYILIERNEIEEAKKTDAGILIPGELAQEKEDVFGKVVAIGPDVKTVQVGDNVFFNEYSGKEIELNQKGKSYLLIPEKEVLAIIK